MTQAKEKKVCPQKTKIEYPPTQKVPEKKFHLIDLVPHKKSEAEIRVEIEKYYKQKFVPANKGVDRKALIEKLQKRFYKLRGALPKGAELPEIKEDVELTDQQKQLAMKKLSIRHKMYLDEFNKQKELEEEEVKTQMSKDPVQELNELFDAILQEIEDRQ